MSPASTPSTASVFASARERRLWGWSALAIAGVYSTLALSSVLSDVFYNQTVAAVAFLAAMALAGITVLTQGLRVRPRGVEIGVGLAIAVVYSMAFFRMLIPERSHLIEYSVVAVLIYEALRERGAAGRRVPAAWLVAAVATSTVGAIDEAVQILLPHRVFDPVDILFNSLAALMAVVSVALIDWTRRRVRRTSGQS